MTHTGLITSADWDDVHLVVFDVDGTLYRQGRLRFLMGRDLLTYALLKRDLNVISDPRAYASEC